MVLAIASPDKPSRHWTKPRNSLRMFDDLSTNRITSDICSMLAQPVASSARIEKYWDSCTSETIF